MWLVVSIVGGWLLGDFLSGVFHWIEDRYLTPDMPIVGKSIAEPNDRHHSDQTAFLAGSYWYRNWTTIVPSAGLALIAWLASAPVFVLIGLVVLSQANEIHAWAHRRVQNRFIRGLQEFGVLQSAKHHQIHHRSPFDCNYCVVTDWLNPVLETVRFWQAVQWAVLRTIGWKVK